MKIKFISKFFKEDVKKLFKTALKYGSDALTLILDMH
jgi:hypothetical protein